MKTNIIITTVLCMVFTSCNLDFNNIKANEDTMDSVEMIDAENSDHLAFKGVPIDGTLNQYVARMKKSGFTYVDSKNGIAILQGDFAGYKNCKVHVSTIEGNDVVSYITVLFPSYDTWDYLYGNYKDLKEMLTEKYGKPSSVKEEFQDKYIDDDYDKIHAVMWDRCKYESHFLVDKGEIVLWIEHNNVLSAFVCLQYKDKLNSLSIKQQAINDL